MATTSDGAKHFFIAVPPHPESLSFVLFVENDGEINHSNSIDRAFRSPR
jgi:hypothetical protein